jgi:hypothetical protein
VLIILERFKFIDGLYNELLFGSLIIDIINGLDGDLF